MDNNNNNDNLVSDLLDIISIYLALKNLELNEQQVNDLNDHLRKQDNNYLQKAIEQNELIISQNNEILRLLKELKNG